MTRSNQTSRSALVLTRTAILLLLLPIFTGCEQESDRLDAIVLQMPTSTRAQLTQELKNSFDADWITFEATLIRAEEMLERGDAEAPEFAGAVLDFAQAIESELPRGGEFELFWRRIGRLAYHASHASFTRGDYAQASSLVLAGPTRWQRDSYWLAYPNHEILVALSMAHQGDAKGGIRLLQSRTPTPESYAEAIDALIEVDRNLLRQRLRENIASESDDVEREMNQGG